MKRIQIETRYNKMLSDIYTPVGIYLRLRDRFRDTILLESADNTSPENSYSFIGINAIGGIEIRNFQLIELKYPNHNPEKKEINVELLLTHSAARVNNRQNRVQTSNSPVLHFAE